MLSPNASLWRVRRYKDILYYTILYYTILYYTLTFESVDEIPRYYRSNEALWQNVFMVLFISFGILGSFRRGG